ncbi:hypothetical protein SALBM311S_02629 [Streptomyces alboniger]
MAEACGLKKVPLTAPAPPPVKPRITTRTYDKDTLRAAKSCGVRYVPLWSEEVFVDHWEFREWDRDLHPGDIVLTHFRGRKEWNGTMTALVRRFLNKVTREGYAVGRLEDL